jgi:hypothetical protein
MVEPGYFETGRLSPVMFSRPAWIALVALLERETRTVSEKNSDGCSRRYVEVSEPRLSWLCMMLHYKPTLGTREFEVPTLPQFARESSL